jgi:hypothetical protein
MVTGPKGAASFRPSIRRFSTAGYVLLCAAAAVTIFSLTPFGLTVLVTGSILPEPTRRWIVVARDSDCTDALRMATRRARREVPSPAITAILFDSSYVGRGRYAHLLRLRNQLVVKNLWLRGTRMTPVLIDIGPDRVSGLVQPLGY